MRGFLPVGVLIAAMAWVQMNSSSQAAAPSASSAQSENGGQASAPAADISPDTPVLTIKGLCSQPGQSSANGANPACKTVVTRAQFERLVEIMKMEKDPLSKQQLSTAYPQILVLARTAEERGLEKEPRVQERLRFARLQILSQELVSQIREEAAKVPEQDIEEYYRQNPNQFEEVSLERIVIPNRAQPKPGGQGATQADLDGNAMSKLADALRARAAAGEDFTKLQKEAYAAAGLSGNTEPNPRMDKMRRRGLPPAHAAVFDLKPGEVSPVISDSTGHYVYKMDSKETESLEAVKVEINNMLRRQRLENMIHQVEQAFATDVNHAYFGAEVKAKRD
jgi:parvulin-like peptidyl-prolyl isomerase